MGLHTQSTCSQAFERHSYVVAGAKPWNQRLFEEKISAMPGKWTYLGTPAELTEARLNCLRPRYVFFLHWSWIVPAEIVQAWECVCFHMTDLPFGRGGSPLQNLIERGLHHTKLSALRMTEQVDAGPVYLKTDLCLGGSAEEVLIRATCLAAEMICTIISKQPVPVPQEGPITHFERRTAPMSSIPNLDSLERLYDFIRMLDAEGYPHAFFEHEGFRFEFKRASLYNGRIQADVSITKIAGGST